MNSVDLEASAEIYSVLLQPGNSHDEFYLAMRRFLLAKKSKSGKLQRQAWNCNGAGYVTFRDFIVASKQGYEKPNSPPKQGLQDRASALIPLVYSSPNRTGPGVHSPSVQQNLGGLSPSHSPRRTFSFGSKNAKDLRKSESEKSEDSPAGLTFAGVFGIFTDSEVSVDCVKFGRLDSELFAFGAADGVLRICRITNPPKVLHVLKGHTKQITDFDWSLSNNFLCSSSLDKSVRVWDVGHGQCLRIIYGNVANLCIRFHPENNNFLLVGNANEEITTINFSTGRVVSKLKLESNASAMDTDPAGNVLFAGDGNGCIHSVTVDVQSGALTHSHRNHGGVTRQTAATSVQFKSFSKMASGPLLLTFNMDGTVRFFSVALEVGGYLSLKCSLQLAPRARFSKVSFCPMIPGEKGELIVTGNDDHNVYFYNFGDLKHPIAGSLGGHEAPVVDVCWNHDESFLASSDCDGLVVLWRRSQDNLEPSNS